MTNDIKEMNQKFRFQYFIDSQCIMLCLITFHPRISGIIAKVSSRSIRANSHHHNIQYLDAMGSQSQVLAKVQEYAQKIAETDYGAASKDGEKAYETLLNKTLYHLENQVQQHKDALEKVYSHKEHVRANLSLSKRNSYEPISQTRPSRNRRMTLHPGFIN